MAVRLKDHVRKGDTVARVGGDEFTVVIRNVHHPVDTAKVAELIQAALREPLIAGGRELFVTASIGISIYPNDGADVETLLKNADTALHRAKEHGPRLLPPLHGLHERGRRAAPAPGERAAAGPAAGRAVRPLPAGRGPHDGRASRCWRR